MIVSFSTSSPVASVALLSDLGDVVWCGKRLAQGRASEVCLELLESGLDFSRLSLREASLFVCDVGPGSFTGVRVGVVLAKTLAWNFGRDCAGFDAFDLIDPTRSVVIPSRKNEYYVREPGFGVAFSAEVPANAIGYGFAGGDSFPDAAVLSRLVNRIERLDPYQLLPRYISEPSISTPKRPLSRIAP